MGEKQHHLDLAQSFAVRDRLNQICKKNEATGYAEYEPGNSDRTIAKEFGFSVAQIIHVRRTIGNIAPVRAKHDDVTRLEDELAELKQLVAVLVDWAEERTVQPFRRPGWPQLNLSLKIVKS